MAQMLPYQPEAYQLLHEGAVCLAEVESNGMCVDVEYVNKTIKRTDRRIGRLEQDLESSDVVKEWRKLFRQNTNLNSGEQLGEVLFGKMGFPPPRKTEGGGWATDEEALSEVDHPFVRDYLDIKKLKTAVGTFLRGIARETVDGRLHPFFNLHTTISYRSSSEDINFQNIPVRDPVIGPLIRSSFVASPGNQIVEIDFSGAEVRVGACYHKDPRMIEYVLDPSKDMHRDMSIECFLLEQAEVSKRIRGGVKGGFVFAEFYGDWYLSCCRNLWRMVTDGTTLADGVTTLRDHLKGVGIHSMGELNPREEPRPGTLEAHLRKVEKGFWGERFKVYAAWKKARYAEYQAEGFFATLTGFVCQGYMAKNQVVNLPIQGSSFHCLLKALIRIIARELPRRKMEAKVVGQIHDSIVGDVPPDEVPEFIGVCRRVMVEWLQKQWPWLIVPMEVEAEVAPVGGSWADKAKWKE